MINFVPIGYYYFRLLLVNYSVGQVRPTLNVNGSDYVCQLDGKSSSYGLMMSERNQKAKIRILNFK